jgi:NAD/NADP transhydrogenase alpha subunit
VTALTVGMLTETATGQHRVALDPETAARLTNHGLFAHAKHGLADITTAVKKYVTA